jgi:hypothetical protein
MTDISKNAELQQSCITAVKSRFFAQYFGVRVFQNELNKKYDYPNYSYPLTIEKDFNKETNEFLELKPLSKITDEDALKCWENDNYNATKEDIREVSRLFLEMTAVNSDYLRSKGYALSYMNYSVEDLISFGWVQLL